MSATEVLEFQVVYYVCLNLTTPLRKVIRSAEDVGLGSIIFANVHLTKKSDTTIRKNEELRPYRINFYESGYTYSQVPSNSYS